MLQCTSRFEVEDFAKQIRGWTCRGDLISRKSLMKKKPGSQSAFFNPRVLIGMLFLAGLLLGLFAFDAFPGASARAQGSKQNSKSGALHKVSVSDPGLAQTLKSQGARVIADYGSFVLLEVNDAVASSLTNNPNAQIVDENNLVLLNAGTIDTRTPEAQALRSASSTKSGKQMRLIQFAGPIRPEWYEALVATGAHIVTYIPSNAYLVYGTAQTLQAVQTFASNESIVQWDGDYTAAYRLDPAVTRTTSPRKISRPKATSSSPFRWSKTRRRTRLRWR